MSSTVSVTGRDFQSDIRRSGLAVIDGVAAVRAASRKPRRLVSKQISLSSLCGGRGGTAMADIVMP